MHAHHPDAARRDVALELAHEARADAAAAAVLGDGHLQERAPQPVGVLEPQHTTDDAPLVFGDAVLAARLGRVFLGALGHAERATQDLVTKAPLAPIERGIDRRFDPTQRHGVGSAAPPAMWPEKPCINALKKSCPSTTAPLAVGCARSPSARPSSCH